MSSLPTNDFYVSFVYSYHFHQYLAAGSITLRPGSWRPGATTAAIRDFIVATTMDDDEMTSLKLQTLIWMIFGITLEFDEHQPNTSRTRVHVHRGGLLPVCETRQQGEEGLIRYGELRLARDLWWLYVYRRNNGRAGHPPSTLCVPERRAPQKEAKAKTPHKG